MKSIKNILLIGLVCLLCFAFISIEKSVNKVVSKVWKEAEVASSQLTINDSLMPNTTKVFELKSNDSLVGYACYSTAFGCKVGGCANPSDPNVQAYETFDYVVVFSPDFTIKKVEVVEYPGAYGFQICRRKWLNQFIGKSSKLELNKDIDGISGATISAEFLISDINSISDKLNVLLH